jgi:hypothetical protein
MSAGPPSLRSLRPDARFLKKLEEIRRKLASCKSNNAIPIALSDLNLTGNDSHWKPVVDTFKSSGLAESCQAFGPIFEAGIEQRAMAEELRQKADRAYVDRLFQVLEDSVNASILTTTEEQSENIRQQLTDEREMLDAIKQYCRHNIDSLKADLNNYRKRRADEEEAMRPRKSNLESGLRPCKPRIVAVDQTLTPARIQGLIRTPYKKRTTPFAPKKLGTVQGVSINHLSPRAKSSVMINHKNGRYVVPF